MLLLFTRWLFRDWQSISLHMAGGGESTPFTCVISAPSHTPIPFPSHIKTVYLKP